MSDLNFLFKKIDSQIRSPKTNIYSNEREFNLPINKNYSLFDRKTDYSSFSHNIYNNISNEKYGRNYKLEENQKYNQLDKKSNGGYDYETNIYPAQNLENINIIKKEIEPYSNNINEEFKSSLNNIRSEIEELKQKGNNLDEYNDKIKEFNNKIKEYQNKLDLLEKDNKNTSNSLKIMLENIQTKDKNTIKQYMELEKKFKDLDNKMEVIKDNQNETGKKLKNSVVNNEDYKDVILNLKNQVNEFTTKIENDSNDKLNKMNLLYEEKNNNINNEIEQLKIIIQNLQEKLNILNDSC